MPARSRVRAARPAMEMGEGRRDVSLSGKGRTAEWGLWGKSRMSSRASRRDLRVNQVHVLTNPVA